MPPEYLSILNEGAAPAPRSAALPGTGAFSRGAGADYRSILDEDDAEKRLVYSNIALERCALHLLL